MKKVIYTCQSAMTNKNYEKVEINVLKKENGFINVYVEVLDDKTTTKTLVSSVPSSMSIDWLFGRIGIEKERYPEATITFSKEDGTL